MDAETAAERSLLDQIHAIVIKHAVSWSRVLEAWWTVSGGNPAFAWMALQLLLDPSAPDAPLPTWLRGYLHRTADNLVITCFQLTPREAPPLFGQALGLSAPARSIVLDAQTLWESPVLVALYEDFCRQAPSKNRAEWAREKLRQLYKLQSDEAVRQRLTDAKAAVRAVIEAQGRVADDKTVSANCDEALWVWSLIGERVKAAAVVTPTTELLRDTFFVPESRRAAVRAALLRQAERDDR